MGEEEEQVKTIKGARGQGGDGQPNRLPYGRIEARVPSTVSPACKGVRHRGGARVCRPSTGRSRATHASHGSVSSLGMRPPGVGIHHHRCRAVMRPDSTRPGPWADDSSRRERRIVVTFVWLVPTHF